MLSYAEVKDLVSMRDLLEGLGSDFPNWTPEVANPLGEPFHSVSCPFCGDAQDWRPGERTPGTKYAARFTNDTGEGSGHFQCFVCGVKGDQINVIRQGLGLKPYKARSWIVKHFSLEEYDAHPERSKSATQAIPKRPSNWEPPDGWCEDDEPTDHDWTKPWKDGWGHPKDGGWTEHPEWWDLAYRRWLPVAWAAVLPRHGREALVEPGDDEVDGVIRESIYHALIEYDPKHEADFSTFLTTAVRHDVIDLIRKEGKRRKRESVLTLRNRQDVENAHRAKQARVPSPEHEWARAIDWGYAVDIILLRLGPEHAWLAWRCVYEGWSIRDHAEAAGISKSNAHRMHKAVIELLVKEHVIGHEAVVFRQLQQEAGAK